MCVTRKQHEHHLDQGAMQAAIHCPLARRSQRHTGLYQGALARLSDSRKLLQSSYQRSNEKQNLLLTLIQVWVAGETSLQSEYCYVLNQLSKEQKKWWYCHSP